MAFKVFLSYGSDPNEQIIAWRLQTLATASGIHVSVSQRNGLPSGSQKGLPPQKVRRDIDGCDYVLAIITGGAGPDMEAELNCALRRGKPTIPLLLQGIPQPAFLNGFHVFVFSRTNPGAAEIQILDFLRQQKVSKERLQAIGALVGIGLGLLALAAFSEK
jgi:TIR domain